MQAYPGSCPPGLLWNGLNDECDFPENVNCEISNNFLAAIPSFCFNSGFLNASATALFMMRATEFM